MNAPKNITHSAEASCIHHVTHSINQANLFHPYDHNHEPRSHGPWDLTHDIALTLENQRNMRREITTLQGTISRTFLKTAQPLRQTASLDHLTTRLAGSPTRLQPQIISLSLSISLIYIYIYI